MKTVIAVGRATPEGIVMKNSNANDLVAEIQRLLPLARPNGVSHKIISQVPALLARLAAVEAERDALAHRTAQWARERQARWAGVSRGYLNRAEAAEGVLAQWAELFNGGPDTSCRTVWQDGIECVSVPIADVAALLGDKPGAPKTKESTE